MDDTTANLQRKVSTAGDLQSVVRTMKALAASSIGQYEQSVRALAESRQRLRLGVALATGPDHRKDQDEDRYR